MGVDQLRIEILERHLGRAKRRIDELWRWLIIAWGLAAVGWLLVIAVFLVLVLGLK